MDKRTQEGTLINLPVSFGSNLVKDNIVKPPILLWEENVAMIRKHNLESDMGIHSYTLGINQFGDMVNIINYFSSFYF